MAARPAGRSSAGRRARHVVAVATFVAATSLVGLHPVVPVGAHFGQVTTLTIKPTFDRGDDLTVGPDGNVWFNGYRAASNGTPRVGRVTPGGAVTAFQAFIGQRHSGITAGPDGNLWLADPFDDQIVRMTPAGVQTTFGSVAHARRPNDLVVGPDGALWFTGSNGTQPGIIGRVTTAGVFSSFPSGHITTEDIIAGPDGNLWYTSFNDLTRMTPTGTRTSFPLGVNMQPNANVVSGPDGNLWWTDLSGDRIGRTNPATGTHTMFGTPGQIDGPGDIVVGPDGNLWFTQGPSDRLGRITPSGTITSFADSTGQLDQPGHLIVGPDDQLWVTGRDLYRFDVETSPAPPTGLAGVAGNGQVALSWSAPSEDGGSTIQRYQVFRDGNLVGQTANAATTTFTVTGLTNGTDHDLQVAAVNSSGLGGLSTALRTHALGPPAAPSLQTPVPGDGQVALSWMAPSDGGRPITRYEVFQDGVEVHETANGSTTSFTRTGLVNGVPHTFEVRAVNDQGNGPKSNPQVATPSAEPPTPTFTDVPVSHPFFLDVEWMASEGISEGFQPGPTFRPAAAVTRAAMSAFMYRMAGEPPFSPGAPTFGDVNQLHPFFTEIEWMAAEGITTGTPASPKPLFKPSAAVSRGAMSAFMYRLAGSPTFADPVTATFGDVTATHPFFTEIEWMAAEAITTGTPASPKPLYKPSSPVSRGAMSAFMHRIADGPGVGA